jgi:asparagine synthase (glutamine-hydrolysing)
MAARLEVRQPLLDHRLIEFAAALPERMRVRGLQGKWLLRRAMRRYLPDEVIYRRSPGLAAPIADWLRGPLAGETRAIAERAAIARTGWFDVAWLVRLIEAHLAGRADHSRLLWQLLMLDRSLVRLGVIS